MPSSPLQPCATPGCPTRVPRGHCQEHGRQRRREMDGAKDQDARALYKSARWQRVRAIVLARDPMCRGEECYEASEHVDHVIPLSERWDLAFELGNLQGLCHSCHNRKTKREYMNGK